QIYSEIHPYYIGVNKIQSLSPKGLILSGGPASVYAKEAPRCDPRVFKMGIPILGICYGMQLIAHQLGGKVIPSEKREYGKAKLTLDHDGKLFKGIAKKGSQIQVWMSHGDQIHTLPPGFQAIGHSKNTPYVVIENVRRKIYGLQFHPEVQHTQKGTEMIRNFLFSVCGCNRLWTMNSFLEQTTLKLRERIGSGKVLCAISGGVDSTVVALLLHRAIGDRLKCIFV
ncbi:MAG: glutamine-hydrolyzing GMP synthase, partial [Thermodesulfobacteriota bacterium]